MLIPLVNHCQQDQRDTYAGHTHEALGGQYLITQKTPEVYQGLVHVRLF